MQRDKPSRVAGDGSFGSTQGVMFSIYGQHHRSAALAYSPLAIGLTASAIAAVVLCPVHFGGVAGWGALRRSITYLSSTVASGLVAFAVCGWIGGWYSPKSGAVCRLTLRFCDVAAWMTPVVIFYHRGSLLAAGAAGAAMTAVGSRLIFQYHETVWNQQNVTDLEDTVEEAPDQEADAALGGMFTSFASARVHRQFWRIFLAVTCMHAAFIAQTVRAEGIIVLFLGAVAGGFVSFAVGLRRTTNNRRSLRNAIVHLCGTVSLVAVGLLAGPALPWLPVISSAEPAGNGRITASVQSQDLISGVILIPQSQPTIKLVAPVPSQAIPPVMVTMTPPAIEFSGAYWVLPMGHMRPPEGTVVKRAAPTEYTFTSVDQSPLMMLAKQRLHAPVSIKCCGGVRVRVHNLDQQPDTIALQVNLVASKSGKVLRQPLNAVTLPPSEFATLEYDFPSGSALSLFEEIEFYFHLLGKRRHRSAKVDIIRFEFTRR